MLINGTLQARGVPGVCSSFSDAAVGPCQETCLTFAELQLSLLLSVAPLGSYPENGSLHAAARTHVGSDLLQGLQGKQKKIHQRKETSSASHMPPTRRHSQKFSTGRSQTAPWESLPMANQKGMQPRLVRCVPMAQFKES